ncbi:MAG: MBL fold metallo-hydrolase [Lachnospiraceae bacterium]|nr:MBL fold metallo-hydrolase [Lachnospiraceae bacterium]
MKLTLLGTGHSTVTECYNSCFVITNEHSHFLVDTGGGNRILKALQDAEIPLSEIHDVFLTREDLDHLMGIFWLIRMVGTMIDQGSYEDSLCIYCHSDLIDKVCAVSDLLLPQQITRHIGREILFVAVESGDQIKLLDSDITFFDIGSEKVRQFGFTLVTRDGIKISCCGDEPYNPENEQYIRDTDWLIHEAFCLHEEIDLHKPHDKHHGTVREACETASSLGIPNLVLYHMEESHLAERKELFGREGRQYYSGNLCIPDDLEFYEIARTLRFPG